jgi:hypothetical protein
MTELLKKGAKFEWGQKCEDAFSYLEATFDHNTCVSAA